MKTPDELIESKVGHVLVKDGQEWLKRPTVAALMQEYADLYHKEKLREEPKPTKERIIEQEVRKVIQSVALHGHDCVLAEKDIFKAVQKFYNEKLKEELVRFAEWYDGDIIPKLADVEKYLKIRE